MRFIVRRPLRLMLCASLVAIAQPALSQPFAQIHSDKSTNPVSAMGGAVLSNGKVAAGQGFKVSHPHTGDYVLQFSKGLFAGLPVFSCTPLGENAAPPVCVIWSAEWSGSTTASTVEFRFFTSDTHTPVNSDFMFTEFTTKTTD